MLYVFEELYLKNKNISFVGGNLFEYEKIKHNRIEILKLARKIPNVQIKR